MKQSIQRLFPGLVLVGAIGSVAQMMGHALPLLGSAISGMLMGLGLSVCFDLRVQFRQGIEFIGKHFLPWSIVGLGFSLPIQQVMQTGMSSLPIALVTVFVGFFMALLLGRAMKIPTNICVLIGGGTAICGGSAIAAMTPIVKPESHEAALSLTTIFIFNLVAVVTFPTFGQLLNLSDLGFGFWAGTAINDTSSVVAAGYAWSKAAGDYATVVKLGRAMLILPLVLLLGFVYGRTRASRVDDAPNGRSLVRMVPWFIVGFLFASLTNRYLPHAVTASAHSIATVMITAALIAIGLSTDVLRLRTTGWKPVGLGLMVWLGVAVSSLGIQYWCGIW